MRSMTGFGRAMAEGWTLEVHSVNRKGFDVRMDIPKELLYLDIPFRKAVGNVVSRGLVTVRVHPEKQHNGLPPEEVFTRAKEKLSNLAHDLGYGDDSFSFPFLYSTAIQWTPEEEVDLSELLLQALDAALNQLVQMKRAEGQTLQEDFFLRLGNLEALCDALEEKGKDRPKAVQEKLLTNLKELMEVAATDERVLKEIALYAEKADFTEEVTRLRSHLKQGRETVGGRALEFLIQEILRELNTIGSKASDIDITKLVLDGKSEVEKMREQVQNIE